MRLFKKFLSLFLAISIVATMVPMAVFADVIHDGLPPIEILINEGMVSSLTEAELKAELDLLKEEIRQGLADKYNDPAYLDVEIIIRVVGAKLSNENLDDWYIYDHYDIQFYNLMNGMLAASPAERTALRNLNEAARTLWESPGYPGYNADPVKRPYFMMDSTNGSSTPRFPTFPPRPTYGSNADTRNGMSAIFLEDWLKLDDTTNNWSTEADKAAFEERYGSGADWNNDYKKWYTNSATNTTESTLGVFDQHINVNGSQINFVGYFTNSYTDFMLYPSESDGEKLVMFDIDGSKVNSHSLV